MTASLVGHLGTWTVKPVSNHPPARWPDCTATIYIGSTWDEPMPVAFMNDVTAGTRGTRLWAHTFVSPTSL